jgi:hypothetical protein
MMRSIKLLNASMMVMLLFAVTASGAAGMTSFHISETFEGPPMAPGALAKTQVGVTIGSEGCDLTANGTVLTNGPKKATIGGGVLEPRTGCSAGASFAGTISGITLGLKKEQGVETIKFKPKLAIHLATGCIYEYSKSPGTFAFPSFVVMYATVQGKLGKGSSVACAPTQETTIFMREANAGGKGYWAEP